MKEIKQQSLHDQLVEELKHKIHTEMNPNDRLPSERDIVKTYSVSRNTVRQALSELEDLGYVYRQHGKGTFVSSVYSEPATLGDNYSFTEQMKLLGRQPKTVILSLKEHPVDNFFADQLHVPYGEKMIKMKRLRLADGVPMMLERTYLPASKFSGMTQEMLEQAPLYTLMADNYNEAFHFADESIVASIVSEKDAKSLKVPTGVPSLQLTRTTYDQHNEVIEFTSSVARSDQFIYRIRYTRNM